MANRESNEFMLCEEQLAKSLESGNTPAYGIMENCQNIAMQLVAAAGAARRPGLELGNAGLSSIDTYQTGSDYPQALARCTDDTSGSGGAGAKRKRSGGGAKSSGGRARGRSTTSSGGAEPPAADGGDCRNQTGFIGVRQRKWGMFAAEIRDGEKRRWLGSFSTGRDAGMAYDAAAISQKGAKAKTNHLYKDYVSIPRKDATREDSVRWDLLPKEIIEHFPIPSNPSGNGASIQDRHMHAPPGSVFQGIGPIAPGKVSHGTRRPRNTDRSYGSHLGEEGFHDVRHDVRKRSRSSGGGASVNTGYTAGIDPMGFNPAMFDPFAVAPLDMGLGDNLHGVQSSHAAAYLGGYPPRFTAPVHAHSRPANANKSASQREQEHSAVLATRTAVYMKANEDYLAAVREANTAVVVMEAEAARDRAAHYSNYTAAQAAQAVHFPNDVGGVLHPMPHDNDADVMLPNVHPHDLLNGGAGDCGEHVEVGLHQHKASGLMSPDAGMPGFTFSPGYGSPYGGLFNLAAPDFQLGPDEGTGKDGAEKVDFTHVPDRHPCSRPAPMFPTDIHVPNHGHSQAANANKTASHCEQEHTTADYMKAKEDYLHGSGSPHSSGGDTTYLDGFMTGMDGHRRIHDGHGRLHGGHTYSHLPHPPMMNGYPHGVAHSFDDPSKYHSRSGYHHQPHGVSMAAGHPAEDPFGEQVHRSLPTSNLDQGLYSTDSHASLEGSPGRDVGDALVEEEDQDSMLAAKWRQMAQQQKHFISSHDEGLAVLDVLDG